MRATMMATLCVILFGLAATVSAEDTAASSAAAPAVTLGKPVLKRGSAALDPPAAEGEPEAASPTPPGPPDHRPTLGKPVVGRPQADEPPAPPEPPESREPPVYVDRRPEPLPPDIQVSPASFLVPPASPLSTLGRGAGGEGASSLAIRPTPQPAPQVGEGTKNAQEPLEVLPMPRPRPQHSAPAAEMIMPGDQIGPDLEPGMPSPAYTRPATWWERLTWKLKGRAHEAVWMPARVHEQLDCHSPCVLCPDLCCCDPCVDCHKFYASGEYLYWQLRDLRLPPLVTTTNDPVNEIGEIGQPGTRILYGGDVDYGHLSGARFRLGVWLDPCHEAALEGSYFFLEEGNDDFRARSDAQGNPLLARPFIDELDGLETVELVSDPGNVAGRIDIAIRTKFWGAELNLRKPLVQNRPCCGWCKDIDLLVGFRYLDLDDDIRIREDLVVLAEEGPSPQGTTFAILDQFSSRNQFYGGQIGFETRLRRGCWVIDLRTQTALGVNQQQVDIDGFTVETQPEAAPVRTRGGLLTQRTNIGRHESRTFSIASEVGATLGYQVTCRTRLFVGYNLLYWTNVARADQQIDRVVNSGFLGDPNAPGSRPAFRFKDRDFWAHGLNAGVEVKY